MKTSPNVAYIKPEVLSMIPKWDLIRDVIEGETAVKEKGDRYLPRPNPTDLSEENRYRYSQYLMRAVFYGVTGRTLNGMTGSVLRKDPIVEVPKRLEPMVADIDGSGVRFTQQSKKCLSYVLAFGRAGLLADFPASERSSTVAEVESGAVSPSVLLYDPWSIINWKTRQHGSKNLLSLVVLSESYAESGSDGFEEKLTAQRRILKLDEAGNYCVEIWRKTNTTDDGIEQFELVGEPIYPTDSQGNYFKFIPFYFVGSLNNDPNPDNPPLIDLATLNVAHYRNSADYEESVYICGQPTVFLSGMTEDWLRDVLKNKIHLGSRAAVPLPENATASILQAQPNSLPKEAMEAKERQMVALGAKLVEQNKVQRTATEAVLEESSENSVLTSSAKNVSHAYEEAFWAASLFIDSGTSEDDIKVELNNEFYFNKMSPQERSQLVAEWQSGAITFEEMRDVLRSQQIATIDDEEVKNTNNLV